MYQYVTEETLKKNSKISYAHKQLKRSQNILKITKHLVTVNICHRREN